MILRKEKIADAVRLSTVTTDKFKSSVISFSITFPLNKDAVAYNLLLSHLLRRGTKSYPSLACLNKRLDELYGSYIEIKSHHIGENLSLSISAEILDNKYIPDSVDVMGGIIDIVSELILAPAFIQKDFNISFFEQEKILITDSINAEINNTRVYSAKKCVELMQESTDIPTGEQLKELISKATFDGLISHYNELISNAPISIFCISAEDCNTIAKKLKAAFKEYPCQTEISLIAPHSIERSQPKFQTVRMPVSQGKLTLGFSTGVTISGSDDSYYTMIMLNEIFGGSASSKLFLNVREKMSLCYYCSSSYSLYSGIMLVSSGFEVKNHDVAIAAILEQLEDICNGKISDAELWAAQKAIISSYRQLYDSPFDLQAFFGDRELFGITDSIEIAERKLLAVTKEQISTLARSIRLDASFFIEGTCDSLGEEDEND